MQAPQVGEIRVLGPLEVLRDGAVVQLARKERQLLVALLVEAGRTRSSDALIDALWPESPPPSAGKLLQVYVSKLRKLLPASAQVATRGSGYALEIEDGVVDATRFEALLADGREAAGMENAALAASLLQRALALWRGAAFGELAYEEPARGEAERLEELRLVCLEERIAAELELGRHAELLPELRALMDEHPLRERLQAQAMLALYRCARQAEALDLFRAVGRRLRDELGLEPGPELRELERRILRHDPELARAPGVGADTPGLPAPPNVLLGRERELAELGELLRRRDARLLVLTGAGGSGKTRLALEAARRFGSDFANGAVFVELAPVRDPDLLVPTIAQALGVREATGESLDALVDALRPQELLLLLDNVEHLLSATGCLSHLAAHAPRLMLLVTSRVVLHLSGERVYPVDPLELEAATELFLSRARDADAGFVTDDAALATVGRICERLDCLPLAIELAASRVRTISLKELRNRLDARLPMLTGGPRDLPARQQTLRATTEWSFDLLEGERQRRLVGELGVFVGGFTLHAAEHVCRADFDELSMLVDANFVRRDGERYLMLETIREFAVERLEASGDADALSSRHLDYYVELAASFRLHAGAPEEGQAARYDLALAEEGNIRAALAWALEHDSTRGLEFAIALEQHWVSHNQAEGRRQLTALIARAVDVPLVVRARALRCLGGCLDLLGEVEQALALNEESLSLFTELGDEWSIIHGRHRIANCLLELGDWKRARPIYAENLDRARAAGFRYLEAEALGGLGWAAERAGDPERALALTREHVEAVRAVGWTWGEAMAEIFVANLCLSLGLLEECETSGRAGLALARVLDDRLNTVRALAVLAARAGAAGDPERAGRLWGAIEAEEARGPIGRGEGHRQHSVRALASGGEGLERSLAAGRKLTLSGALAYALATPE